MNKLVLFILLIITASCSSQAQNERKHTKMESRFFTQEEFNENFGKEMSSAQDLYDLLKKNGLTDYALGRFDFVYISDQKDKLDSLGDFLRTNYGYTTRELKKEGKLWELSGDSNEIPVDSETLMYWALDLYVKGYEFDCTLDGYGTLMDYDNPKFLKLDPSLEDHYFEEAMKAYESRNLGEAIISWTTALKINPKEPNSYYSRAIVKNELYTWKAALSDYDKAIELVPDFASALVNRAALKDESGDYDGAINDYNRAIEVEPTNAMAFFNRGNSKLSKEDSKGACEDWHKAKELGADYAEERISDNCK